MLSDWTTGLYLNGATDTQITSVTTTSVGPSSSEFTDDGLTIDNSHRILVQHSVIEDGESRGIDIGSDTTRIDLVNVTVRRNAFDGIALAGAHS